MKRRTQAVWALLVMALVTSQALVQAETYYYDNVTGAGFGTAGGTWAAPTPGPNPGWTTDGTGAAVPGSVTTLTTDSLNFGNGATGLGGGTITISGTVDAGDMTFASGSGAITLSGGTSINLAPASTITVNNANNTISTNLVGAATSVTKAGTGQLTLSGANSFTGQLNIENGTVRTSGINNKSANGFLGAGTMVVLGASGQTGRLAIQVDGGISSTKDFTLAAGGTGEIQFGNLGTFQITNADRNFTISGNIGGGGNLVKLGGPALVLTGNNNYSGTTTVNEGPLRLGSANALPGGIGATGGASALTINGNGTINVGAVVALTAASGNFLRGLGTGVDQFQIPGGISGFEANGSTRQVIVNNDTSFELVWGIPTFNPSALLFGYHSVTATGALTLQNKIDLNGATRTITVNANTATLSGDIRTSSGTAGLTKTGAGTLVLSGANTYNGATTINAGTLTISNAAAFNDTSAINLALGARLEVSAANASLAKLAAGSGVPFGTFLRYSSQTQTAAGAANGPGTILGTVELNLTNVNPDYTLDFGSGSSLQTLVVAIYTSPITLSGNASLRSINPQAFTLNTGGITASTAGTKTLTLTSNSGVASTINSVIGDGSGTIAVKTEGGAWTLTGANTYSGATTATAGTLTLSGANGSIGSSAVTIEGGTLTIANTGAANNGDRLSDSAAFTMNGGTFNFNNDVSNNTFSESAGTLTLIGGANTVAILQAGASGTSTLTFAGLSRTAGAVNFSGAGLTTAVDPRSKITFTNPPALTDGIIGPWATVNGTAYATIDANSNLVAYGVAMTDVTRQNSGAKVIPDSATADVRIIEGTGGSPANLTLAAATTTIRTLMQSISGGSSPVIIDVGSGTNLLVNSINQVATAGSLTIGVSGSAGTISPAAAGGNLLLINNSANNMTNNSVIADNTTASTITKDGAGTVSLAANNTYTGGLVMNAGILSVTAAANLGSPASITFSGDSKLLFNVSGGTLAIGSPVVINTGVTAKFDKGGGGGGGTFTFNGALSGSGTLSFSTGGGGSGNGTLNFNAAAAFTGTVELGSDYNSNGGTSMNVVSLGDGGKVRNAGTAIGLTFNYTGSGATFSTRQFELASTQGMTINGNGSGALVINTPLSVTAAGNKTLTLGGTFASTFAGDIADGPGAVISLNKAGNTWNLSGDNTYSGNTTILNSGGTIAILGKPALSPNTKVVMERSTTISLRMDDAGTVNLGNEVELSASDTSSNITSSYSVDVRNNGGANTDSTLVLGKLDFAGNSGNNASSRRILTTGANGYRLQFGDVDLHHAILGTATGGPHRFEPQSAPITIAGTVKQINGNTGGSTVDNNLYLGGIASGNLISGIIADADDYPSNPNATPLNITKGESSEWILSGVNTYSGATTVSAGTLVIDGGTKSQCLPDTGLLAISGAGQLQLNTGVRERVGSLKLGAGDVIAGPTTYGSTASSAINKDDTYFAVAGTGVLYVGMDIPADGTVIIFK